MTSYIAESLFWTVAGFVFGYLMGSAGTREVPMWPWIVAPAEVRYRLDSLERQVATLEGWRKWKMAKDKEALARLDEQIAALRDYIHSDEETDAAEVDRRAEELRQLLVEAQGSGELPAEEAAPKEEEVAALVDEAKQS